MNATSSQSGGSGKKNLMTPEQFRQRGMITPDHIRELFESNTPLVGERLKLADFLDDKTKLVGDLTSLRDIMAGIDFSDVNLSSAFVGHAGGSMTHFLPKDPRFLFNEKTRFNNDKDKPSDISPHDKAMELLAKRGTGAAQAQG